MAMVFYGQRLRDRCGPLHISRKQALSTVYSLASDWFWATDEQHRFIDVFGPDDAAAKAPFDNVGKTRWELTCPEERKNTEKWDRHHDDLAHHRPFDNFPYQLFRQDGSQAIVAISGRPVFGWNGRFSGYVGIARDITSEMDDKRRLEALHHRLTNALEALDTAVAMFDEADKLILHNSRMADLFPPSSRVLRPGISRQDVLTALKAQDEGEVSDNVQPPDPTSGNHRARYHGAVRLGDGRYVQLSEQRARDGHLILAATDVTSLRQQAHEAESATRKLTTTLQSVEQGLLALDRDGKLSFWNEQIFELLGVPIEVAVAGMPIHDLVAAFSECGLYGAPLSSNDIDRRARHLMSCDPPRVELRPANGRVLDARRRKMPDGGIAISATDISVLKQRESDLARTTRELEIVFDTVTEGIALLNREHVLVSINDRMLELTRIDRDALDGEDPIIHYCRQLAAREDEEAATAEEKIRECVEHYRSGQPFILESIENDGRAIEFEVNPTADGGRVITCRDMTDRRRHVQELRQAKELAELANRAKTEFLANTSHELRTPLNAIIGFAEMIQTQTFGPLGSPKYREYATDIRDSGAHLLSLINDLLDLAKIESGHQELFEAPLLLPELLTNCMRLVSERAEAGKVKLATALDDRVSTIFADERAMKQVLINLLSNAVKFTPPGGRVIITNRRMGDGTIEIAVSDTGIGMNPNEIPKALEPFGQVDGHLSRRFEGTGLGLPLAQRLIQGHGGTLTVESEKGVGTTVTVHLPADRHIAHLGDKLPERRQSAQ